MKFHEQTNQQNKDDEFKHERGIQQHQQQKTGIQYNGPAGDADNDVMDQSSSQMISQRERRQEESCNALDNSNGANGEINFYA